MQAHGIHSHEFPQHVWQSSSVRRRRAQILNRIGHQQNRCKSFRCNENRGIVARTGVYPGDDLTTRNCPTPRVAAECAVFYACYCHVELDEDPPGPRPTDVTIDDFQNALNRIPMTYKLNNGNCRFDFGGFYGKESQYISWEGAENHRALAPDTKEPYWLEGPDESQEELSSKWMGLEYNPGMGSSVVKREEGG
ncbi:hypothetical protein TWF506_007593 [Arthrobotrys conoides]|uniref:Uncharacterized protein n=1 Tax=Arthrobotrys conoides TaxID=74498 RepID=A0AAN8RY58_9PEZI